jgi:Kef-type K+ transport system membrane component KefB
MVLLIAFAAVAEKLGLETILGAFMAGAVLTLVDRDQAMTHPDFRRKLEVIGFGVFIPVFFVTSGIRYDLQALLAKPSNLLMVPIFLAALVAVRGIPALVYRRAIDRRQTLVAALMQATSLPFIVAASAIGVSLHLLTAAESAALIAAGLLSGLLFPLIGLTLLRRGGPAPRAEAAPEEPAPTMAM